MIDNRALSNKEFPLASASTFLKKIARREDGFEGFNAFTQFFAACLVLKHHGLETDKDASWERVKVTGGIKTIRRDLQNARAFEVNDNVTRTINELLGPE